MADTILVIIANILIFIVYFAYFRQVVKDQSTPNPATWIIWFTVMLVNAITYSIIAENFSKSVIAISVSAFIGLVLFYSIIKGKLGPLMPLDKIVLIFTGLIGLFWQLSGDTNVSNLLLQIIIFISFIPTAKGILRGELKDKAFPWTLATVAYSFQIAAVLVNFNGNYYSIVFPLINGILGNGMVAIIIVYVNKKRA